MNDQRCTCHTRIPCDKCIEWAHNYMKKKDIVAELRDWGSRESLKSDTIRNLFLEASDEIEDLRYKISKIQQKLQETVTEAYRTP